ncbi:hypothetical protein [Streptomyces sp. NPDC003077]|uniref:hypothetical protein n=1 Tax=Streptomyces sp. NPDC003077 TaxID=3154443 RepID=UPI0033A2B266
MASVGRKLMGGCVSHRGWWNREVELVRSSGSPTLVELRSTSRTSMFHAFGVTRNAECEERSPLGAETSGKKWYRFLLEPAHTHVVVQRVASSGDAGGFGRWQLRILPLEEARHLSGTVRGESGDVVRCPEGVRAIHYSFDQRSASNEIVIIHMSPNGKKVTDLTTYGLVRGTLRIPGPGYLHIGAAGTWELSV